MGGTQWLTIPCVMLKEGVCLNFKNCFSQVTNVWKLVRFSWLRCGGLVTARDQNDKHVHMYMHLCECVDEGLCEGFLYLKEQAAAQEASNDCFKVGLQYVRIWSPGSVRRMTKYLMLCSQMAACRFDFEEWNGTKEKYWNVFCACMHVGDSHLKQTSISIKVV